MRYSQKDHSQEFCNGSVWMTMASLSPGSRDLYASSCREIALRHKSSEKSGAYWIKPSEQGPIFKAYCDAREGWTLIMKINGSKQTFLYDSVWWSNKMTLNEDSLQIDDDEAKFASYWTVPFTELRVGMKLHGSTRWITIIQAGASLYSLIADGQYRSTSIGKIVWRSLLPSTSMQHHCNKEGFNVHGTGIGFKASRMSRARLGIISNQQEQCNSPDSFVGLGTSSRYWGSSTSAGNSAADAQADNGEVDTQAIGYIMVR
jgi:hypothetical protein